MADNMIYRGAYGFREAVVIKWCWNRILLLNYIAMADSVELTSTDTWLDMRTNHLQNFCC